MKKHYLIRFTKKQGRINKTLEGLGVGMLKLWALQNTTPTTDCFIFDDEGTIVYHTVGTSNGFPEVNTAHDPNIEDYCPGLLLSLCGEVQA